MAALLHGSGMQGFSIELLQRQLTARVQAPRLGALLPVLTAGVMALWGLRQVGATALDWPREQWASIIASGQGLSSRAALTQINDAVNLRLKFRADVQIWGREDFWATPLEALGAGAGDCEDFSIAKYAALLQLGVPNQKLRLIYVRAALPGGGGAARQQAHMVLGYYPTPQSVPLILDNLVAEVRSADQRPDLLPVFSFNATELWAGGRRAPASPSEKLSRWRGLLRRMQQEGTLGAATNTEIGLRK